MLKFLAAALLSTGLLLAQSQTWTRSPITGMEYALALPVTTTNALAISVGL